MWSLPEMEQVLRNWSGSTGWSRAERHRECRRMWVRASRYSARMASEGSTRDARYAGAHAARPWRFLLRGTPAVSGRRVT